MTAASTASDGLWSPQRRPLTLGLVLTITLVAAEALAVTTAMPVVVDELGGLELYGLVFTAFLVGSLVGTVVAGSLIDRRGILGPFLLGIGLFAVGLVIAGAATSMPMLIGARFIQGLGGGAVPPIAYVAIGRNLPEALRPRMFATLSTAWILPGVIGPALAGIVVTILDWRWIFFGLLPLLAFSGALAYRGLTHVRPARTIRVARAAGEASVEERGSSKGGERGSPDGERASSPGVDGTRIRNGILVATGVGMLSFGLTTEGGGPAMLALAVAGAVLGAYAFVQLVPPGTVTAARGYPTAILLRGVLTFAFFAVDVYVPLLLQEVRGWSALAAGIAVTAATLSWTAGSWTQARLSSRFPHEDFVRVGFPVVALGIAGLGLILLAEVPAWLAIPIFGFTGYGMGLTYAQFALIVLRDVPHEAQGEVTSSLTLSDSVGTALGTGIAAAFVHAAVASTGGPASGLAASIALGAGVAFVGWLLSPRLSPKVRAPEPATALR